MNVSAIIPTLNPTKKIFTVVNQLCIKGFTEIIIVNDGSEPRCAAIFDQLKKNPCCVVLTHPENRGKGAALKTAFRRYMKYPGNHIGVITLDDDGQHDIESIVACANALEHHRNALILGTRNFSLKNIPFKNRYGNKITSAVFAVAYGLHVSDTQTGLRVIPNRWLPVFLKVGGKRFEYETNMLLATKQHHIPICEVPISTIYQAGKQSTHFRPIADSVRIYGQLLWFLVSSLLSFAVDIIIFWLLSRVLPGTVMERVFWSTLLARAVSSLVNFFTNRNFVFKRKGAFLHSVVRYYLLCIVQAGASLLAVGFLGSVFTDKLLVPIKMLVDGLLFCLSFRIQNRWVFRRTAHTKNTQTPPLTQTHSAAQTHPATQTHSATPLHLLLRTAEMLAVLLLAIVVLFFGATTIICYGPSQAARNLFVSTVMETSAAKFLARMYFDETEINTILQGDAAKAPDAMTDTDAITIAPPSEQPEAEDITVEDVRGNSFVGKMMIVKDPARMEIATLPAFDAYGEGMALEDLIAQGDAVAGINAGGFLDPNGMGHGGMPMGVVIHKGKLLCETETKYPTIIGFNAEHKLIAGNFTAQAALDMGIQEAVS
ncbi:MAG: glycosyltransferase, partial [Ruthenibacterium sp.]